MQAILIDHDDSFTQNLKHWLKPLFSEIKVVNHRDFHAIGLNLTAHNTVYILSPGPKNPDDYPKMIAWLENIDPTVPVFGVCLGMQMMARAFGIDVKAYSPPQHGKKSKLKILNSDYSILSDASVARYHSLFCDLQSDQKDFLVIAKSDEDQIPMWIQAKNKKWMAVQFHPESFLTEKADELLHYLGKWVQS